MPVYATPARTAGSLKRDVSVGADAEDLKIDSARVADGILVCCAGRRNVGPPGHRGPAPHPAAKSTRETENGVDHVAVALGMVGGQADVLVQGEAPGLPERDLPGGTPRGEFVVDRQRRRAGGQAQDRVGFAVEQRADRIGGHAADLRGIGEDDDFHLPCSP